MSEDEDPRVLPQSSLDFNLMTTDTVYGSNYVPDDFRENFVKKEQVYEADGSPKLADGKPVFSERNGWRTLSMFQRDIRLGNVTHQKGELDEVRHYLKLAADLLNEGLTDSAAVCLNRVASLIESSHSKGGWFRQESNKIRHESTVREDVPKDKSLLKRGNQA